MTKQDEPNSDFHTFTPKGTQTLWMLQ